MTTSSLTLFGLNGVGRIADLTKVLLEEVVLELNGIGSVKISMDPLLPVASQIALNRTEIWVWLNENLYIETVPRRALGGPEKVTFECEEVSSYLQYAYVVGTDLVNTALDQFNIGWNLVTRAQTGTNADRRIFSGPFINSGIVRTVTYKADELPNIWDALTELTQLDLGFDWALTYAPDGRREWMPYYPSRGSYKALYSLELDRFGRRKIVGFTYNEDGISQATDVYDAGGTLRDDTVDPATETKIIGHYEDAPQSVNYGRMTKVISDASIIQQAWLDAKAKRYQIAFGQPLKLPDLEVSSDLLGNVFPGDTIPIRIDFGRYQIIGDYRINKVTFDAIKDTLKLGIQLP